MSKAQHIVDRLLESDPDDLDPKAEFMRVDPEMQHWLQRNGFISSLDDGWWHKEVHGVHYNVREPVWGDEIISLNGWTVSAGERAEPVYHLSADECKRLLANYGVARP